MRTHSFQLFQSKLAGRSDIEQAYKADLSAILALDPDPTEALYKKCDEVLGIPADASKGGLLNVMTSGREALFVVLHPSGPIVATNMALGQMFKRNLTPGLLGLVVVDDDMNLLETHLLPCWAKSDLAMLAQRLCEDACRRERQK
jgi:hypothetical protein